MLHYTGEEGDKCQPNIWVSKELSVLVHKENLDNSQGQRNECIDRNFSIAGDNF